MTIASFERLMALLQVSDSTFPSGSFAFSNGLETLVSEKRIKSADDLEDVIERHIVPRWLEFDRWFLFHAHSSSQYEDEIVRLDRFYTANMVTDTLARASLRVGNAMLSMHQRLGTPGATELRSRIKQDRATGHATVVQGVLLAGFGLNREETQTSSLYAALSASVSAAVRLGAIGALEGQRILLRALKSGAAGLETPLPEHPYTSRPLIDIAVMRHVGNPTRLFAA